MDALTDLCWRQPACPRGRLVTAAWQQVLTPRKCPLILNGRATTAVYSGPGACLICSKSVSIPLTTETYPIYSVTKYSVNINISPKAPRMSAAKHLFIMTPVEVSINALITPNSSHSTIRFCCRIIVHKSLSYKCVNNCIIEME